MSLESGMVTHKTQSGVTRPTVCVHLCLCGIEAGIRVLHIFSDSLTTGE
jgi:hypothetical protein